MDGLVLSDGVFDRMGNKLFNLLRGRAGPCTGGHGNSHRDIRILPLWHGMVAKPAPYEDANQEHPGNLGGFNERPGEDVGFLHPILVASDWHRLTCALG